MNSPNSPQQPSQQDLVLAYQELQRRKEKNRIAQANFRNSQKSKISSLEAQVQSLQSQVHTLQSQLHRPLSIISPVSSPNPQLLSQLQQFQSDISSRDLTILQLQQRLSQVEPYGPFLQWLNQTYPATFQQFNTFQEHQHQSSIPGITNVHLA